MNILAINKFMRVNFFGKHEKIKSINAILKWGRRKSNKRFSIVKKRQSMIAQIIQVRGNLNYVTDFLHFQVQWARRNPLIRQFSFSCWKTTKQVGVRAVHSCSCGFSVRGLHWLVWLHQTWRRLFRSKKHSWTCNTQCLLMIKKFSLF